MAAPPGVERVTTRTPAAAGVFPPSLKAAAPATSGPLAWVALGIASAASAPDALARTAPSSLTRTARTGDTERSRPRLSIDVPLHLAPLQRQGARVGCPEQFAVHAREKPPEPPLVRHREDDHAGALFGRKLSVVQIITIERDQRP